jgi:hypothetical protein
MAASSLWHADQRPVQGVRGGAVVAQRRVRKRAEEPGVAGILFGLGKAFDFGERGRVVGARQRSACRRQTCAAARRIGERSRLHQFERWRVADCAWDGPRLGVNRLVDVAISDVAILGRDAMPDRLLDGIEIGVAQDMAGPERSWLERSEVVGGVKVLRAGPPARTERNGAKPRKGRPGRDETAAPGH